MFAVTFHPAYAVQGLWREPRHPAWSKRIVLDGASLDLRIWLKRHDDPTEIVIAHAGKVVSDTEGDTFYDGSVAPYVRVEAHNAYLAYAAGPSAGSGFYAMVWKISDRGRRLEQIGQFDCGDLRQWFGSGVVREIRLAKNATEDILRVYPALDHTNNLDNMEFVAGYRFDRRRGKFKFLGAKAVPYPAKWPYTVRFPRH